MGFFPFQKIDFFKNIIQIKNTNMSRTSQKIAKVNEQIGTLKEDRQKLIDRYNLEKQQEQDIYFTIRCIPSKSNHCQHTTGLFSTYDKAFACLPESLSSHDSDDNCSWFYSIECIKSDKVSNFYNELDKHDDRFPYSGW